MWITNKLENQQFVMRLFANKQNACKQKQILMCLLFVYYFFGSQKIRKVLAGVLARVLARSPGSNPGFDVSLSHFKLFKILKFSCLCL